MYKKIKVYLLTGLIIVLCLLSYFSIRVIGSGYDKFVHDVISCQQSSTKLSPEKIAELNRMPFVTLTDLATNTSMSTEVSSISTDTGCILNTKYYGDDKSKPEITLMLYPIKSSNNTVATFHEHWNCHNYDNSDAPITGFQTTCTSDFLTSEGSFGVNLITTYSSEQANDLTEQITVKD